MNIGISNMEFSEVFIDACKTDNYYDALHKLWRNKDWLEDDPFVNILERNEREQKEVEYYVGLDMLFIQLSKVIYKFLHKYYFLFYGNPRSIELFEDYIKKNLFKDLNDFCKDDFKEFPVHNVLEKYNKRLLEVVGKFYDDFYNEQLEYIMDNIVKDDIVFGVTDNNSELENLMEVYHDFIQDELADDLLAGKKISVWISEKTREKYIMGIKTRFEKGSFWISPQLILDALDLEKLKEE